MPRQSRLQLPGVPLHVMQRGVNRCAIFMDDVDRQHYYKLLCDAVGQHDLAVHAYVFMDNHVHLLLTPSEGESLSLAMRRLGQCYVQAFNRRHGRTGALWQGRFKSCLVDSESYVMAVYRYIELNPVRAGMVQRPEDYRWSSVRANLYLSQDNVVNPHPVFLEYGTDAGIRARNYQALLRADVGNTELEDIRRYMQQEKALGDAPFQTMVERALGRPVGVRPRGRPGR